MSLNTQAKVLRVLQEQQFTRVGGTKLIKVDVRVIAASNQGFVTGDRKGDFRDDLFYRLNSVARSRCRRCANGRKIFRCSSGISCMCTQKSRG